VTHPRKKTAPVSTRVALWTGYGVFLVGFSAALILGGLSGLGADDSLTRIVAGLAIPVGVLSVWFARKGSRRSLGMLRADWMPAVVVLMGLPGILIEPGSTLLNRIAWTGLLAFRSFLLFAALPRVASFREGEPERQIERLALVAVGATVVAAIYTSVVSGVSLESHVRLTGEGNDWINANTTGLIAAFGVVLAANSLLSRFWKTLLVVPSIYVLILTQSRTSMAAMLAALAATAALTFRNSGRLVRIVMVAACLLAALSLPMFMDLASDVPQLESAFRRTSADSSLKLREEKARDAWVRIIESPVVGYGFLAEDSRFENGGLTLAIEIGLVGLLLCAAWTGVLVMEAWRLHRSTDVFDRRRGAVLIALTVFLLVHSFGERTHPLQLASLPSNAWLAFAGGVSASTGLRRLRLRQAVRTLRDVRARGRDPVAV
jgi:hypothetical protein